MKIAILNGSPKGKYSITLQTSLYLQKLYPEHSFTVLHIGQRIKTIEQAPSEVLDVLADAELLLFSYPVYTFLAPSQLHRFFALLKETGIDLRGKFATQISTSKHFFDTTAHRYVQDNCADLGLKYIKGLSADMEDLTTEAGQKDARDFFERVLFAVAEDLYERPSAFPAMQTRGYAAALAEVEKKEGKETVIVADLDASDKALFAMIADFQAAYPYPSRLVNIREYPFSGGCLGCFHCAADGTCVYRDGFERFLREEIQTADSIVYAFRITDHSMGAKMKLFDDRQFCNGHRTVTEGMPVGYLALGDLSREENLRTVMEARSEVGRNVLCGIATDSMGILSLCKQMTYALEHPTLPPRSFYGVGGMKIFRDLIYLMRGLMRADHKFYKKHGIYDFPQKKKGTLLKMQLVGILMNNKTLREKAGGSIQEGMIAPYRKVLDAIPDETASKVNK